MVAAGCQDTLLSLKQPCEEGLVELGGKPQ